MRTIRVPVVPAVSWAYSLNASVPLFAAHWRAWPSIKELRGLKGSESFLGKRAGDRDPPSASYYSAQVTTLQRRHLKLKRRSGQIPTETTKIAGKDVPRIGLRTWATGGLEWGAVPDDEAIATCLGALDRVATKTGLSWGSSGVFADSRGRSCAGNYYRRQIPPPGRQRGLSKALLVRRLQPGRAEWPSRSWDAATRRQDRFSPFWQFRRAKRGPALRYLVRYGH